MIIMSLIILSCWTISILVNFYLGDGSLIFAAALFFPNLFVSLCLVKLISNPLIPIFENMGAKEESVDYIGLPCTITLPATATRMGQAEVILNDSPLLINVKLSEGTLALEKGSEALIVAKDKDCFFIQLEKS